MIKLFASDLDGTLLNVHHKVDEVIENTIRKINDENKVFCISTGRSMYDNHIDDFVSIDGLYYCISLNGAMIQDKNREIIYMKPVNHEFVMKLMKEFPTIPFECCGVDRMYYRRTREEELERYNELVKWSKFHQSYEFDRYHENTVFGYTNEDLENAVIVKVNCKIVDENLKKEFNDFVEKHSDLVTNAPFMADYFELTDIGVHKGSAVKQLAKMLHIEEDEVAVYGDGLNDLTMLSSFKHSYAPSNASEKVQKCANEVIGSYVDYAVCIHMLEFLK